MADPVALLALMLDATVGWPDAVYRRVGHPVGTFARIIAVCDQRWNDERVGDRRRRIAGIATLFLVTGVAAGVACILSLAILALGGPHAWIGLSVLAAPGLAQRSLHEHVSPVAIALASKDIEAARTAVARIVGRDVATLDASGVARAATESLAESFCDGIVAPLFWLLVLGVPGLWAYKAINTADSMIGHKEPRWKAFGWSAARIDDAANYLPARLAGFLICVAGAGGFVTLWQDGGKHASPNAGRPEAAMAGVLGVRLAGPITYDGVTLAKPWIGAGRSEVDVGDLKRALAVYRRACLLLWLIAGAVVWAR